MSEPVCNRCGACCYFYDDEGKPLKCKYLILLKSGKTLCRIYNTRIGKIVAKNSTVKFMCGMRVQRKEHHVGCPYNELIKLDEVIK